MTLRRAGRVLGQVAATFREQALANQWRHVPGSPIEGLWRSRTDLQGEWGDEPLQSAFYSAVLTSVCVLEHLEAVADCYQREPFRRFPALSLARSLTEGAARVAYALSPNIGADDLVTRGLNDQLYAMREDDAVIKGIVTNPAPGIDVEAGRRQIQNWSDLEDGIFAEVDRRSWQVTRDRSRAKWVGAIPRPTSMSLLRMIVDSQGDGAALGAIHYRSTSAVVHAQTIGIARQLDATMVGGRVSAFQLNHDDPDAAFRAAEATAPLVAVGAMGQGLMYWAGWDGNAWLSKIGSAHMAWQDITQPTPA